MMGENGKRRSVFKVDVHLGEHETAANALAAWSGEIDHLRSIGRENKAEKLEGKLNNLQGLGDGVGMTQVKPYTTKHTIYTTENGNNPHTSTSYDGL